MHALHRIAFLIFATVPASALLFGGCGGKASNAETPETPTTASPDGGSADGATSAEGGRFVRGTHSPGCPEKEPAQGTPCTAKDLHCEYGDDFDPSCNVQLHCGGTTWAGALHGSGSAGVCPSGGPPKDPPIPPNAAECPAAQPSGACTGEVACRYGADLGTVCACGPICHSYPVAGCQDGGHDWRCGTVQKTTTVCPVPRPRLGEPCTPGESCRVGPSHAESCEETSIGCVNGQWLENNFGCPVSSARHKEDIAYVSDDGLNALANDLLTVKLATYKYRPGVADGDKHLGFIIEDQPPGSPAVLASRERVDLYGYISMAVGAIQVQQKEIEALRREVTHLKSLRGNPRLP